MCNDSSVIPHNGEKSDTDFFLATSEERTSLALNNNARPAAAKSGDQVLVVHLVARNPRKVLKDLMSNCAETAGICSPQARL
ncbi:hypothetical protein AGIG_G17124 [Arapaima gigas]